MPKMLEQLHHQFYEPSEQPYFQSLIDESHQALIQNLSKSDRKLVLRIVDSKDSIRNYHTVESFICGFNLATEILTELKQYNQEGFVSEVEMNPSFSVEEENEN